MPIRRQPNMKPPMNINGARPNWPLPAPGYYSGFGKSASLYAPPNPDFPSKHGFYEDTGKPVVVASDPPEKAVPVPVPVPVAAPAPAPAKPVVPAKPETPSTPPVTDKP